MIRDCRSRVALRAASHHLQIALRSPRLRSIASNALEHLACGVSIGVKALLTYKFEGSQSAKKETHTVEAEGEYLIREKGKPHLEQLGAMVTAGQSNLVPTYQTTPKKHKTTWTSAQLCSI